MVVNVQALIMAKVVIKILQGSAVTQTMLGGLTIYTTVANFHYCTCAENYENWLTVDNVIAKITRLTFFAHPVYGALRPVAATIAPCIRPITVDLFHLVALCLLASLGLRYVGRPKFMLGGPNKN